MKAIIFDMDGVIFDTERLYMDSWKKVGEKYGLENVEKMVFDCIGVTAERTREIVLSYYGENFEYDKVRGEVMQLVAKTINSGKLGIKTGVFELLDFLKRHNIPAVIASSTKSDIVGRELEMMGLIDYFADITGGDEIQNSKPAPDIFLLAAKKLGFDKKDLIVIEDSFNGVRAAYSAGIRTFMVPDLLSPDDEMHQKAEIFKSLLDVKKYLADSVKNLV